MRSFFSILNMLAVLWVAAGLFIWKPSEGTIWASILGFAMVYLIVAFVCGILMGLGRFAAGMAGQSDEQIQSRYLQDQFNERMLRDLDRRAGNRAEN